MKQNKRTRKIDENEKKQHPITKLPSSFSLTQFILKEEKKIQVIKNSREKKETKVL